MFLVIHATMHCQLLADGQLFINSMYCRLSYLHTEPDTYEQLIVKYNNVAAQSIFEILWKFQS